MGGLSIPDKILNKYFGYLKYLDIKTKKYLIKKLKDSMLPEKPKNSNFKKLFGAWEDDRSSDEIIEDIRDSFVVKIDTDNFKRSTY